MVSDKYLFEIIARYPGRESSGDLKSWVVDKLTQCPICKELFSSRSDLVLHLKARHVEELAQANVIKIPDHKVEQESTEIYICPFCHYAVGDNGIRNLTSDITHHLEKCPLNAPVNGLKPIRIQTSKDPLLIHAYNSGEIYASIYLCRFCEGQVLGSEDSLLDHICIEGKATSFL